MSEHQSVNDETRKIQQVVQFRAEVLTTLLQIRQAINPLSQELPEVHNADMKAVPHLPFSISAVGKLPNVLECDLVWYPEEETLQRSDIVLEPHTRGKGYGKAATRLTEDLAKRLGAKRFILSSIVNTEWRRSLKEHQGYQEFDPPRPHELYKEL